MPNDVSWRLWWRVQMLALIVPDLSKRLRLPKLLGLATPDRPRAWCQRLAVDEIVRAVDLRLRSPWRMRGRRCLRHGLITFHLLRLSGRPAVLHFAVFDARASRTKCHCWVTLDGVPLTPLAEEACTEVLRHA